MLVFWPYGLHNEAAQVQCYTYINCGDRKDAVTTKRPGVRTGTGESGKRVHTLLIKSTE